jgi:hypothetical protein
MTQYSIDDVAGDDRQGSSSKVLFLPTNNATFTQWDPVGGTCAGCTNSGGIDASKVHGGSWHSTTASADEPDTTIEVTFTGKYT